MSEVPNTAAGAPAVSAAPRTARKRRSRWAIAALVAVILIVAGVVALPMIMRTINPVPPVASFTVVETGRLVVTASADGQAQPVVTDEIHAEVGGTVASVDVAVGDRVKVGDALFVIDDEDLQAVVRTTNAQLKQAKQQVAASNQQVAQAKQQVAQAYQQVEQSEYQLLQARNRLDSLESLTGTRTATASEIDEAEKNIEVARLGVRSAKAGVTSAKAGLTSAKAGLSSAKTGRSNAQTSYDQALADLDKVVVTAPSSGVVTAVNVSEGGSVSSGASSASSVGGATTGATGATAVSTGGSSSSSAPVVISDTSELQVTVAVNEVDISEVKVGQEATITFDALGGLEVPGKVTWVSPNAVNDGTVSTYDVELALIEQNPQVKNGMTATADIVAVTVDEAVLVQKSSVKVDGTTKYVTVVNPDGSTEKRIVTTGPSDETRVQILTGLVAGERIASAAASGEEEERNGFMPPAPGGMGGGPGRPGGGN